MEQMHQLQRGLPMSLTHDITLVRVGEKQKEKGCGVVSSYKPATPTGFCGLARRDHVTRVLKFQRDG